MPVRDEVLNWLAEAQADLRYAEMSISTGRYNWACFIAQQAAEKALKALMLHVLGEYPRGHDLVKLYRRVKDSTAVSLSEVALAKLSAYYTLARYPNAGLERPSEEILREHAEEAISIAKGVLDEVSKAIQDP
ncbi:MAG: HEPN domain-containing protein [Desulfurococcus sp.]|jgi:HEPN domain-containing protein|uniref:HEPN domain-containing protein n=1 Tax=Desulfurococcus sp. TaxID=51678 RepID=UPI0031813A6E